MGAWGYLPFENDDACDWAGELENTEDLSLLEAAFKEVESAEDYLEAPQASTALAASEVLARLNGRRDQKQVYPEPVEDWVTSHPITPSPVLLKRAIAVIDRILGENSELRELWAESNENAQWLVSIEDLRARLAK